MQLEADLHTHSIASGHAYNTVTELVEAAKNKGLLMLGITDHGPAMPGGPHLYHFGNLRVLPDRMFGVELLRGVEANVIDHEGNIDVPERYLRRLDWVGAGFHPICYPGGTVEENTTAMIRTLQHPLVDMVVHPGNPQFPIDYEKVVRAARQMGKLLEINNSSLTISRQGSKDNCETIACIIAKEGGRVVIGSDAHYVDQVGNLEDAYRMSRNAGLEDTQILNTSVEKIKLYLKERGKKRFKDYQP